MASPPTKTKASWPSAGRTQWYRRRSAGDSASGQPKEHSGNQILQKKSGGWHVFFQRVPRPNWELSALLRRRLASNPVYYSLDRHIKLRSCSVVSWGHETNSILGNKFSDLHRSLLLPPAFRIEHGNAASPLIFDKTHTWNIRIAITNIDNIFEWNSPFIVLNESINLLVVI